MKYEGGDPQKKLGMKSSRKYFEIDEKFLEPAKDFNAIVILLNCYVYKQYFQENTVVEFWAWSPESETYKPH